MPGQLYTMRILRMGEIVTYRPGVAGLPAPWAFRRSQGTARRTRATGHLETRSPPFGLLRRRGPRDRYSRGQHQRFDRCWYRLLSASSLLGLRYAMNVDAMRPRRWPARVLDPQFHELGKRLERMAVQASHVTRTYSWRLLQSRFLGLPREV